MKKNISRALNKMEDYIGKQGYFYQYINSSDDSINFWENYYGCKINNIGGTKIGNRIIIATPLIPESKCMLDKEIRYYQPAHFQYWIDSNKFDNNNEWVPKDSYKKLFLERILRGCKCPISY